VYFRRRINVTTKLISHFTIHTRFWKFVQFNYKLKQLTNYIKSVQNPPSANVNQFVKRLGATLK
jgi:hypothetical protein